MLTIDIEVKGKLVIFTVQGEISPVSSREFERAFEKFLSNEYNVLAIDFKKVRYIDSYAISKLVKLSRTFAKIGGEFLLVNMNDNIRQIFRMAGLDRIIRILTADQFEDAFPAEKDARAGTAVNGTGGRSKSSSGPVKSVQYKHNDISGTTLLFDDEYNNSDA